MDSNLSLAIGFKGAAALNGVPVFLHQLPMMQGGVIDPAETVDATFGRVVSILAAEPSTFRVGIPATAVVAGILVFDPAIAQNDLGHPDKYFAGQQASAVCFGPVQLKSWQKTAVGAIDPVPGCKVITKDADGSIEFLASATAVPANWTQLKACFVRNEANANGVTLFVGVTGSLLV